MYYIAGLVTIPATILGYEIYKKYDQAKKKNETKQKIEKKEQ